MTDPKHLESWLHEKISKITVPNGAANPKRAEK